jgi:hypothetical protein
MSDTNEVAEQVNVPGNDQNTLNAPRSGESNGKIDEDPPKVAGVNQAAHVARRRRGRLPGAKNKPRKSLVEDNPPSGEPGQGNGVDYEAAAMPDSTEGAAPQYGARPTFEELEAAADGSPSGMVGKIEETYDRREPRPQAEFFRTHQDLNLWIETILLVDKDGFEKPVYLVGPLQRPLLQPFLKRVLLVPTVNQDGEFFVWPILIADITLGQRATRTEQANREIVQQAQKVWTCRVWDPGKRKHIGVPADQGGAHLGDKGRPQFPEDLTRKLILSRTFSGAYIGHNDHEMIKLYRGLMKR